MYACVQVHMYGVCVLCEHMYVWCMCVCMRHSSHVEARGTVGSGPLLLPHGLEVISSGLAPPPAEPPHHPVLLNVGSEAAGCSEVGWEEGMFMGVWMGMWPEKAPGSMLSLGGRIRGCEECFQHFVSMKSPLRRIHLGLSLPPHSDPGKHWPALCLVLIRACFIISIDIPRREAGLYIVHGQHSQSLLIHVHYLW